MIIITLKYNNIICTTEKNNLIITLKIIKINNDFKKERNIVKQNKKKIK